MVQDPLATRLLQGEFKAGDRVVVDEGPNGAITFTRAAGVAKGEATVH
jgi:ATP-dependent Clp protease ATP-binding subunit ClpB